ncbi:hypothetical protein MXM51_22115 [Pantoea stewartii]|uniref:hypothetical protein n=1 Tax=Pantoea stewartii TaxID=66269 RepID=UPI002DBC4E25|nr:hypothetical protein [Pantoea stewartii]MEB6537208.1 hypothetical protein [Pantoea stewartii]
MTDEKSKKVEKSDWPHKDNKHYKGHLDRIYVSKEEEWEIGYFVDKYLEDHNSPLNEYNRTAIMSHIATYPGKAPIKREELKEYLDKNVKFSKS